MYMDKREYMNDAVADFVIRTVNSMNTEDVNIKFVEALTGLVRAVNQAPTTVVLEAAEPKKRWPGIIPRQF